MDKYIVVMGVAGCGKSSLGAALAQAEGLPLVEGDDFHSAANRAKMSQGIALTDADRDGWLDILGQQLQAHPGGMVLTCSALKRRYRDRLRLARPGRLHGGQRRTFGHPYRGVLGRRLGRPGAQHDAVQDRPPHHARDLDHARIAEELA